MKNSKKDAYYFSHDANARTDENVLLLRSVYGWEGYGIYWAIVEILRESTDGKYCMNNIPGLNIALNLDNSKYEKDFLLNFINDCIKFKLFEIKSNKFFSNRLLRNIEHFKQTSLQKSLNAKGGKNKKDIPSVPPADPPETKTNPELFKQLFEGVWKDYPNKDGRKAAEKHFYASVKSEKDYYDFTTAMNNYLETDKVKKGFIKNGSTFFNNWRDYIVLNGIHKPKNELEPEKF